MSLRVALTPFFVYLKYCHEVITIYKHQHLQKTTPDTNYNGDAGLRNMNVMCVILP